MAQVLNVREAQILKGKEILPALVKLLGDCEGIDALLVDEDHQLITVLFINKSQPVTLDLRPTRVVKPKGTPTA